MLRDYLQNYDNRNSTIEHVLHRARSTTTDQSEKQRFTTLIKQNMPPLTYLYRKAKDIDTIPTLSNAPLNERASKAKSILATGKLTTGVSGAASAALLVATVYCGIKSFHARKRIQAIIPAINNDEKIKAFIDFIDGPMFLVPGQQEALAKKHNVSMPDLQKAINCVHEIKRNTKKAWWLFFSLIASAGITGISWDYLDFGKRQSEAIRAEQELEHQLVTA